MKRIISISVLFLCIPFSIFFASCLGQPPSYLNNLHSEAIPSSSRGRVRTGVLLRDSREKCSKSRSCQKVCDRMYLRATGLDRCYKSSEEQIKKVAVVFDILSSPKNRYELRAVNERDLQQYMRIDYLSFMDLMDRVEKSEDGDRLHDDWEDLYAYDPHNAELVLEWIAENKEVAKVFSGYRNGYLILEKLFQILGEKFTTHRTESDSNSDETHPIHCPNFTRPNGESEDVDSILGFSANVFDTEQVSFMNFANAFDNASAVRLVEKMVRSICENSDLCEKQYYCLARYYDSQNNRDDFYKTSKYCDDPKLFKDNPCGS